MEKYILPFVDLLVEMAPYLLLGFFVAGLLHAYVSPRFYTGYLGGKGLRPVLSAALMGVPLPLCSCGVIPTAISLKRSGASNGATVSFLISTPQTGVDSILATAALMGWPFALIRPITAFITGIFGGAIVNHFERENSEAEPIRTAADTRPEGFLPRMKLALRYGFVDMMQDIGKWLVIGLIIAGLITIIVPTDLLSGLRSYPLLNMLVVLVIAAPMYVCATGSIPIAMALMMKGLSPGAALVFLMAGPATNMASILVLRKTLKRRTTALYILAIVLGSIACGLMIDYLLPASWFALTDAATAVCHRSELESLKIFSALVFVATLVYAMSRKHNHEHGHDEQCNVRVFKVEGMRCNHCRAAVEQAVKGLEGVENVNVDITNGTISLSGPVDDDKVISTVKGHGYNCSKQ